MQQLKGNRFFTATPDEVEVAIATLGIDAVSFNAAAPFSVRSTALVTCPPT